MSASAPALMVAADGMVAGGGVKPRCLDHFGPPKPLRTNLRGRKAARARRPIMRFIAVCRQSTAGVVPGRGIPLTAPDSRCRRSHCIRPVGPIRTGGAVARTTVQSRGRVAPRPDPEPVARGDDRPTLSIVIAAYNEEDVLDIFFARLEGVLASIGESYEIICVNDGSRDRTAAILAAHHARDRRIRIINLARNFGKELALTAGLDATHGRAVVPLDADLQDPPELIADFLRLWREGYDVVYAVRNARATDSWMKRTTAAAFYAMLRRVSNVDIPPNAGDFRLMDQRVVEALRRLRERNRFMKGLFSWVGFRQTSIGYERPVRAAGKTKFNYWKLWNFALDGITGYSTLPLRFATYFGFAFAVLAMVYGALLLVRTLIWGADVPGYASTMVAVIFMGGMQLFVLGIIGEYLGRLYSEAKQRPLYIVDSRLGFEGDEDPDA